MSKAKSSSTTSNAVHFTLQGKGGVGKSLVSALVAQYFQSIDGCPVKCIDTDPVNQTLVGYKSLKAQHIKLMDDSKIDERNFDLLMERLLSEDGVFVVDNGASSFVALSNYLVENNAIEMLQDAGREVFIHCVVAGGQALVPTIDGFRALAEQPAIKNIVVWLNEYFGDVIYEDKDTKETKVFNEMLTYLEHANKVRGIVRIARRNQDTFGKDVQLMASSNMTFNDVFKGSDFTIMAKQRLKTVQRDIFDQLNDVGF